MRIKDGDEEVGSVYLPQIGRQDIELSAVFRNGAARNDDPFILKHSHDRLIRERLALVLLFEDFSDHVFHAGIGHAVAAGSLNTRSKEVLHFEDALRSLHVLPGYRSKA